MSSSQYTDTLETNLLNDSYIQHIEEILGYTFRDKSLASEALTHRTFYFPSRSPELHGRLEYIGDSILNYIVNEEIFFTHPGVTSGDLTRLLSVNTDKEKLGRLAVKYRLHYYIRHKDQELQSRTQKFIEDMQHYPVHSNGLLDPPKALSDVVESLIGAVYVDTNKSLDIIKKIFMKLLQPLVTIETLGKQRMSELNELYQSLGKTSVVFKDKWNQSKTVEILLNGEVIGRASYDRRKDVCKNRAAEEAINRIKQRISSNELKPVAGAKLMIN